MHHVDTSTEARGHGACLARRLLAGAGRAVVTTFDEPALDGLEVLAHRWSPSTGRLLAACALDRPWPADVTAAEARVRLDKLATLPDARILAGSLHALAGLRVLRPEEVAALPADELGPLAEVGGADGVRLCALDPVRVLLHAGGRVVPFEPAELMRGAAGWTPGDELVAVEAVLAHGEGALARLADAVVAGWWPGDAIRVSDQPPACGRLLDRALLVDVTAHGVRTLITSADGAWLVTAEFTEPATSADELRRALRLLLRPAERDPRAA